MFPIDVLVAFEIRDFLEVAFVRCHRGRDSSSQLNGYSMMFKATTLVERNRSSLQVDVGDGVVVSKLG